MRRLIVRLSPDAVERTDRLRAEVQRGIQRPISRAAVIRLLVERALGDTSTRDPIAALGGLDAVIAASKKPPPPRSKHPSHRRAP